MSNAVIAVENMQEVKSKTDRVRVRNVEIVTHAYLPGLRVIVKVLFPSKRDSCRYWKCHPAQREPRPEWAGKAEPSIYSWAYLGLCF